MGETVTAYVQHLQMEGKSPNTIRLYLGSLRDLNSWLGTDGALLSATHDDLLTWRSSLRVAPASVAAYVAGVRSYYRWCVRRGLRLDDPSLQLPVPRLGRRLPRPIAEAELEYAIDCAYDRIRPWLVLAGYAGLRCIEIARLRREDIHDSAPDPFMFVYGKGRKERSVPLSEYVWTEIRQTISRRGWAFPRRDGKPGHVPAGSVSKLGNEHLQACGLSETMHQLRHRFGTQTYEACRDIRIVQELMGHSSPSTTAAYAAHNQRDAVRVVSAVQPKRRLRPVRDQ